VVFAVGFAFGGEPLVPGPIGNASVTIWAWLNRLKDDVGEKWRKRPRDEDVAARHRPSVPAQELLISLQLEPASRD
jgi:hypothetical protein